MSFFPETGKTALLTRNKLKESVNWSCFTVEWCSHLWNKVTASHKTYQEWAVEKKISEAEPSSPLNRQLILQVCLYCRRKRNGERQVKTNLVCWCLQTGQLYCGWSQNCYKKKWSVWLQTSTTSSPTKAKITLIHFTALWKFALLLGR